MDTAKKRKIRYKFLLIMLKIFVPAMILFSLIAIAAMNNIRTIAEQTNTESGLHAASDSQNMLEAQAKKNLLALASDKAELLNRLIAGLEKDCLYASALISSIYSNPDSFGIYPIPERSAETTGIITPRFTFAESGNAYRDAIDKEYSRIGNAIYAFDPILHANDSITTIYFCSESGLMLSYDKIFIYSTKVHDMRTRDWYINAKEQQHSWSNLYDDIHGRGPTITYSLACYDSNGIFIGVLGMDILLKDFSNIIMETHISENGHAFLTDGSGSIIASTLDTSDEQLMYTTASIVSSIMVQNDALNEIHYDGEELFIAYLPLKYSGWCIGLTLPRTDVTAPALQLKDMILEQTLLAVKNMHNMLMTSVFVFIFIFCFITILVTYLSFLFSRKITDPILALTVGVEEISGGNLNRSISVNTGDEIETLADAFNQMTADLKIHIRDIARITADKERIATELNVAANIQASMLPRIFPPFPNHKSIDIYATMQPAKEVGGDFYDFFLIGKNRVCIIIADVSGKGVPAALFMVIAKTLIKNQTLLGLKPHEIFYQVNNQLCEGNHTGMFVTAFLAILDFETGRLEYSNAGHNPPILCRKNGTCEWLDVKRNLVLAAMEDFPFVTQTASMSPGDSILLYTDGVTEAMNRETSLYTENRLFSFLSSNAGTAKNLTGMLTKLRDDIDIFAEGAEQADDITMLILKYIADKTNHIEGAKKPMKELYIDADVKNLDKVLSFIHEELTVIGCDKALQTKISIAVEEIFVNIAKYAYCDTSGNAAIRIHAEDEVFIEFEDNGIAFNPLTRIDPDITQPLTKRSIGGLGIYMVKQSMDSMTYRNEDGKNILTITKKIHRGIE